MVNIYMGWTAARIYGLALELQFSATLCHKTVWKNLDFLDISKDQIGSLSKEKIWIRHDKQEVVNAL